MLPVQRFTDFIELHHLFSPSEPVLAAVSGGRDSVLLVHLLKQAGYTFGISHCNFQLRGAESDNEQQFTEELAKQLGVPFYTTNFDTQAYAAQKHISIQMAARDLRYQWFDEIRAGFGYSKIAVAHHQNDSVETILLNLSRGTGIAGMHGILPLNGNIARPLLFLTRDEIDTIVTAENLRYVEDSSNASVKYARNKLRHEVIPKLKELNPQLEQTFKKNMERFRELELLLEDTLARIRKELLTEAIGGIYINIAGIKKLIPQRLLLFGLLSPYGFNQTSVDDVIASFHKHSGRTFESAGYRLILDRGQLIISKRKTEVTGPVLIYEHTHEVVFGDHKLTLIPDDSAMIVKGNPMAFSADADKLTYPLTLRHWHEGDTFYPLGMKGKKKLSDYFISEKIPLNQKADIPVLVNGNGDVIWIGGMRPDERYKVATHTKKVIIFELYKTNL
ncbi:tRNA lysidine(34) synthetase TilS [Mucilaginibacter sp. HMF5004]|nr:tRNA lysidine(34) synthetase TilS [Mucilaginibacter rivuli]